MSLFGKLFGNEKGSAKNASDRLKLVLAHERVNNSLPFIEDLKKDLEAVIRKYVPVENIDVKSNQNQNVDFLEIEIKLDRK